MTAGLDVVGQLTILTGDQPFRVEFRGDVVTVELPDLRAARAIGRAFPRCERRAWLRRVQTVLGRAGLELQVWVGPRQVARLTGATRPGRLAAWLRLDPLELRARGIFATLTRRRVRLHDREVH